MQTPGPVFLDINHRDGLELWIDGEAVPDPSKSIDLSKGRKEITFAFDPSKREKKGLSVLLGTESGSPTKFKVEGGI